MNMLEERILKDGRVVSNTILKVDSFLNHQLDVAFIDALAEELYKRYADQKVTKILTIEASGIPLAYAVGRYFGVPVVFGKKSKAATMDEDLYVAEVDSYTRKETHQVVVSKRYLSADDHVLIIDDFMANGRALLGLTSITEDAGATLVGFGIAIEKAFQIGSTIIRQLGYRLESIAIIESMNPATGEIIFRKQ